MAKETDQKGRVLPTKVVLTIRVLVGAYLLYTAYSLIGGVTGGEGRDKYFFAAFIVFFTVAGIILMIFSGRDLMRGKYAGGAMDPGEAEEETAVVSSGDEEAEKAEEEE